MIGRAGNGVVGEQEGDRGVRNGHGGHGVQGEGARLDDHIVNGVEWTGVTGARQETGPLKTTIACDASALFRSNPANCGHFKTTASLTEIYH